MANLRVYKHGFYKATNHDLKIRNRYGKLMAGSHHVVVMSKQSKKGFVKVKTITSLENVKNDGTCSFHDGALKAVKDGEIIPIPLKDFKTDKFNGIYKKPIWIHKSKLMKPERKYKYPKKYHSLIK